jgi:hypothetical protein
MATTSTGSKALGFLKDIEQALVPLASESLSIVEQGGLLALQSLMNELAAKIAAKAAPTTKN